MGCLETQNTKILPKSSVLMDFYIYIGQVSYTSLHRLLKQNTRHDDLRMTNLFLILRDAEVQDAVCSCVANSHIIVREKHSSSSSPE